MSLLRKKRTEKLLRHVKKSGRGLEIGPSYSPIAPKRDGFDVDIIDHADRERLVEKYKVHGVPVENIEEVDFVWNGEPYAELTGRTKHYDWIIASHVVEHTPDLIGFLVDCESVLKEDGILSLAVPDKRYCFDHFRPVTGIGKIIDAHFPQRKTHSPGTGVEQCLNEATKGGNICWRRRQRGTYRLARSVDAARDQLRTATSDHKSYQDFHAWCFTPESLRLIVHDLHALGLIGLREVSYYPTSGCEFFITLGRQGEGLGTDRMTMLRRIDRAEMSWTEVFRDWFSFSL